MQNRAQQAIDTQKVQFYSGISRLNKEGYYQRPFSPAPAPAAQAAQVKIDMKKAYLDNLETELELLQYFGQGVALAAN